MKVTPLIFPILILSNLSLVAQESTPASTPARQAQPDLPVSTTVIRAGGFGDFANKRKVKVTRKNGQDFTVDLKRVIEEGRSEEDLVLQPDDQIYVPQRLINM